MQNTAQRWLVYQLIGSNVMLGTVAAVEAQQAVRIVAEQGNWRSFTEPWR